jgi:hypothetical protein
VNNDIGAGDGLLEVDGAAGSEADSSSGTALSDGATRDSFSDDKNGAAVEVVTGISLF